MPPANGAPPLPSTPRELGQPWVQSLLPLTPPLGSPPFLPTFISSGIRSSLDPQKAQQCTFSLTPVPLSPVFCFEPNKTNQKQTMPCRFQTLPSESRAPHQIGQPGFQTTFIAHLDSLPGPSAFFLAAAALPSPLSCAPHRRMPPSGDVWTLLCPHRCRPLLAQPAGPPAAWDVDALCNTGRDTPGAPARQ
jgi:hypothetical protein